MITNTLGRRFQSRSTETLVERARVLAAVGVAVATIAGPCARAATIPAVNGAFTAGGDRLAYQSFGHGPILIILAGGPGMDPAYMAPVAQAAAQAGFRAILLSQRGVGESYVAAQSPGRLSPRGSAEDIEDLRLALGADKIAILGHSFGGAVAQAYAAAHPERVERLVLMDSVGPSLRTPHGPTDSWRQRLTPAQLKAYQQALAAGDLIAAARIKFEGSFDDPTAARAFVATLRHGWMNADVLQTMSESFDAEYDLDLTPLDWPFPVVILSGADDWMRGYEPDLKARYPAARTRTLEQANHFPWVEKPQETWVALRWALHAH